MAKKRNYGVGVTGQALVDLVQTKEAFLTLCKQYDHMGQLLSLQTKAVSHPIFAPTTVPAVLQRILEQYHEIGEQLKHTGKSLDKIGGDPVLEAGDQKLEDEIPKFIRPKLKREPKKIDDGNEGKTFVSNIPPEEEKKKKDEKKSPSKKKTTKKKSQKEIDKETDVEDAMGRI